MDIQRHSEAAVDARRGFEFQTTGLLLYLLLRRIKYPDLEVVIDPNEGEDAKLIYAATSFSPEIIEFVQYKKHERHPATLISGDDWNEGHIGVRRLKKWVESPRATSTPLQLLAQSASTFFTVVVFGDFDKGVRNFIPKLPTMSSFREYCSTFSKVFPADYVHDIDPLPNSFGSLETRRKIRIVRFSTPAILEAQCRICLELFYGVSRRRSGDVVDTLTQEISRREKRLNELNRVLRASDIAFLLGQGREDTGLWRDSREISNSDGARHHLASENHLTDNDFRDHRYAHLAVFEEAWVAVERDGFIVVCGSAGIGKTTLCKYLAWRFLQSNASHSCFWLQVLPTPRYDDEIAFIRFQVNHQTLFVIDDQQLAPDAVEHLITTFTDRFDQGKTRARLVVASSITYGRTQDLAKQGINRSELNRAELIHLQPLEQSEMEQHLKALRESDFLRSSLSDFDLSLLGGGNFGLTFIVDRCAADLSSRLPDRRMFERRRLLSTLAEWILKKIGRPGENEYYDREILPVLLMGSFGVLVPRGFSDALDELWQTGFLERLADSETFRVVNLRLAALINTYHQGSIDTKIIDRFLDANPGAIATLFERLAAEPHLGRNALQEYCRTHFQDLLSKVLDSALTLDQLARTLRAIDLSSRRTESSRLLRAFFAPEGRLRNRVVANLLSLRRTRDVDSVTHFLNVIFTVDRYVTQRLFKDQLMEQQLVFVLNLFDLCEPDLDSVGRCINAFRKIVPSFAMELYDRFIHSSTYNRYKLKLQGDLSAPFLWLRWASEIRFLSFSDASECVRKQIYEKTVTDLLISAPVFSHIAGFLRSLSSISPKGAASVVDRVWDTDRSIILNRLISEPSAIAITSDLFILSKISRRIAAAAAWQAKSRLEKLLADEDEYDKVGSALDNLRRHISERLAGELLDSLVSERLVLAMKKERFRYSLIGRFLETISDLSSERAEAYFQRLDYRDYIHPNRNRFLFDCVHLIRGLLRACPAPKFGAVLEDLEMLAARDLRTTWDTTETCTEVAYYFFYLLRTPLTKSDLATMLGFAHPSELANDFVRRIARERSAIGVASGLYVLGALDPDAASRALSNFWDRVRNEATEIASTAGRTKRSPRSLPQGYRPTDVSDLASLLKISSAIDQQIGILILESLDLTKFADYCIADAKFGRLATFLNSLHGSSRQYARKIVQETSNEEMWRAAYLSQDSIYSLLQYARSVAVISRQALQIFLVFIFSEYKDDVLARLENEANALTVADWLRTIVNIDDQVCLEYVPAVKGLLISAMGLDQRLWNLLEACESLIESNSMATARAIADSAAMQIEQMASLRDLKTWIQIVNKLIYIGRALSLEGYAERFVNRIPLWYFTARLLRSEDNIVLHAFAHYLLETTINDHSVWHGVLHTIRQTVRERIDLEPRSIVKALSWMLTGGVESELGKWSGSEFAIWERGLCALVFSLRYKTDLSEFALKYDAADRNKVWAEIEKQIGSHTNNLEYGLALYAACVSDLGNLVPPSCQSEAAERAEDEISGGTRWLLANYYTHQLPGEMSHYIWQFVTQTILRFRVLAVDEELEESAKMILASRSR